MRNDIKLSHKEISQIAEVAAKIGVLFTGLDDFCEDEWNNRLRGLTRRDRGKVSGVFKCHKLANGYQLLVISFYNKRGMKSATCKVVLDNQSNVVGSSSSVAKNSSQTDDDHRSLSFERYRDAFYSTPVAKQSDLLGTYLDKKGVAEVADFVNLRILSDSLVWNRPLSEDTSYVAVPIYRFTDAKGPPEYVGHQRLYKSEKMLTPAKWEGAYSGAFAIIGDLKTSLRLVICEGFGTGASYFIATNDTVIVALSASNIAAVVEVILARYKDEKEIVIAADNDFGNPRGNIGLATAFEIAQFHKLKVCVPPVIDNAGTDWNDVHMKLGVAKLRSQISSRANNISPSKSRSCFLKRQLSVACDEKKMIRIIKELTRLSIVPFKMSKRSFRNEVKEIVGGKLTTVQIHTSINDSVFASEAKAKRFSSIAPGSVDVYERFETQRNEKGYWVMPKEMKEIILYHFSKGRRVVVRSPKGTRKTELQGNLKIYFGSYLLVNPRKSTVQDSGLRLNIGHYQELSLEEVQLRRQIGMCCNSIGSLRFRDDNGIRWTDGLDVLVLDEASQIYPQLIQLGEHRDKVRNVDSLYSAQRTASNLLLLDADANEFLIKRLRDIDPKAKIALLDVIHSPEALLEKAWDVRVSQSRSFVKWQILEAVASGEKVLVAIDNKNEAKEIKAAILQTSPHARILCIHSFPEAGTRTEIDNFLRNPTLESLNYDVLIYTPVITSGLSIEVAHFTMHFALISGVIKPNDVLQMCGRDRTAKDFLIWISSRTNQYSLTKHTLEDLYDSRASEYDRLHFACETYEAESRQNFLLTTLHTLRLQGHNVSFYPDIEKGNEAELTKYFKAISRVVKTTIIDKIISSPDISDKEFRRLKLKLSQNENDIAVEKAFKIRNELCAELNESTVTFLQKDGIKKVEVFETLLADRRTVAAFDEAEVNAKRELSQRFFAVERNDFLLKVIESLGLDLESLGGEFTHEQCRAVLNYCLDDTAQLYKLFGINLSAKSPPKCATTFVKKIFDEMGLKLGSRKSHGRMIRFIDSNSLNFLRSVAEERARRGKSLFKNEVAS